MGGWDIAFQVDRRAQWLRDIYSSASRHRFGALAKRRAVFFAIQDEVYWLCEADVPSHCESGPSGTDRGSGSYRIHSRSVTCAGSKKGIGGRHIENKVKKEEK